MPPQDLPPGLYDHPLSEAEHQVLSSQLASLHQLEPLDPAEAPQRLARYLRQLSEIALASLPQAKGSVSCAPATGFTAHGADAAIQISFDYNRSKPNP
jgi:hypothetical protein